MFHVVVAFSEGDLKLLSKRLNERCILLSDAACSEEIAEQIQPRLSLTIESELSSKVRDLFDLTESKCGVDSLSGFANNFYECAVAPVYSYIVALNDLLEGLIKRQKSVEVWFPAKHVFKSKHSAYFMAEHESQGTRLYSREAVFLPYLEEICKEKNVIIKY